MVKKQLFLILDQKSSGSRPDGTTIGNFKRHQKPVSLLIYRLFLFLSYQCKSNNFKKNVS